MPIGPLRPEVWPSQLLFQNLSDAEEAEIGALLQHRQYSAHSEFALGGPDRGALYIILSGCVKAATLARSNTPFAESPTVRPWKTNKLKCSNGSNPQCDLMADDRGRSASRRGENGSENVGIGPSPMLWSFLGQGEVLGELAALQQYSPPQLVICLESTRFTYLESEAFKQLLKNIPTLSNNLFLLLARRQQYCDDQIRALATLDVNGRVARQLLLWARQYGRPLPGGHIIPFYLTQTELAGQVGASREKLNKVLQRFKNQGYISVSPQRHFVIYDFEALENFCR